MPENYIFSFVIILNKYTLYPVAVRNSLALECNEKMY